MSHAPETLVRRGAPLAALLAALGVLACTHTEPFEIERQGSTVPFRSGPPALLTANPFFDGHATWFPDQRAIAYAAEMPDTNIFEHDVCLRVLPPTGGRSERDFCVEVPHNPDSSTHVLSPAINARGEVAFVHQQQHILARAINLHEIAIGRLDAWGVPRGVRSLPVTPTLGGVTYVAASSLRWLNADTLVFLGVVDATICTAPLPACAGFTSRSGAGVVLLNIRTGAVTDLAGSAGASSVDTDGGSVYYTIAGEGVVYRWDPASRLTTTALDFGPSIARAIQVRGSRVVALVDGTVVSGISNGLPAQFELGGRVALADLGDGSRQVLAILGDQLYFDPALSPDGRRLLLSLNGDLYLHDIP